jgi:Asp-tRNA(Asn)/Glu-tRNA(Gln) amidotransferase A subunit family amidase
MARTVADVALLADVLGGRDAADEQSLDQPLHLAQAVSAGGPAPRLGLVRGPYWSRADAGTREAIMTFVAGCGVGVDTIDLPPAFAEAADILMLIMEAGIAESFHADAQNSRDLMPDLVLRTIARGRARSAVELLAALTARDALRRAFDAIAAPYDALITPAAIGIAPLVSEGTGDPIFATTWTLLGAPALSLPLLSGPAGMPLGVQLVAGTRRDAQLLRAAAFLMQPRS